MQRLLVAIALTSVVCCSSSPTHLVLLRHDADGLRWLDQRWTAVTDPRSSNYRLFETREEILRRLAPYSAGQQQQFDEWLDRHGWSTRGRYGDALLVEARRVGDGGDGSSGGGRSVASSGDRSSGSGRSSWEDAPDRPPEIVAIVPLDDDTVPISRPSRAWRRVRRASSLPLPLGLSASTLREMYSVPPAAANNGSGVRVSNWQGIDCKVFRPDIESYCRLSGGLGAGGDSGYCMDSLNTSVSGVAPSAADACIEGDLDSEMLLAAAPAVANVVGVNGAVAGFLPWAVAWFNQSSNSSGTSHRDDGVPLIASVSWGNVESTRELPGGDNGTQARLSVEFQKLGVLGRAVFWASGDGGTGGQQPVAGGPPGSFNCTFDLSLAPVGNTTAAAAAATTEHHGGSGGSGGGGGGGGGFFTPGFPATSPYVTACGGTELTRPVRAPTGTEDAICAGVVVGGFGSGCASGDLPDADPDARGEVATSLNVTGFSSGGGFSWWFARPGYQQQAVAGYLARATNATLRLPPQALWSADGRAIPDVASAAGNTVVFTNGEAWLGGGTSAAAPWWAGVWALATRESLQATGRPLGPAGPFLYVSLQLVDL